MELSQFLSEELEKIDDIYFGFINEMADKKAKFINPEKDGARILSTSYLRDIIDLTKRLYEGARGTLARAEEDGFMGDTLSIIADELSTRCRKYLSGFLGEN